MRSREGASLTRAGPRGEAPRSAERGSIQATLKGRTGTGALKNTPNRGDLMYSRYILRRTRAGNPICIRARTKTADFYGWSSHFEIYTPGLYTDPSTGARYVFGPELGKKKAQAGYSILISRTQSKNRGLATYCNYFRITGEATIADLAHVAAKTDIEWNWMETPSGERRSREKWLAIHEAWTKGREGGVVSL